jgi:microcystin degradation protein MlrC
MLYPHSDAYERGAEVIDFLADMVGGRVRPAMHLEALPMMITTTTTDLDPARRMNEICADVEAREGVVDCTIFHGFPMTDVPAVGMSVLAITNGEAELAGRVARQVGEAIWEAREEYRPRLLSPEGAIALAAEAAEGLVVINDTSDNPGGGAPGDATHLLRAMLAAELEGAAFGCVYDPEVAAGAHRAGAGATIRVRLGGKTDELHGAPIEADAYVKTLTDGRFTSTTRMLRGVSQDVGPSARLVIGGVDVLVTSHRQQVFDGEVFLLHGIDVRRRRIVGLKSSHHFREGFRDLAAAIIPADSPGATSNAIERLPHRRVRRPIWPLDDLPDSAYS